MKYVLKEKIITVEQYVEIFDVNILHLIQNLTIDQLLLYCKQSILDNSDIDISSIELSLTKVIFSEDKTSNDFLQKMNTLIEYAIDEHSTTMLNFLIGNGAQLEQKHMEYVFKHSRTIQNYEKIILVLFNNKLIVTKECFMKYIEEGKPHKQINSMNNLFVCCGLQIDLDCVEHGFKHGYILHDLTSYGIEYDDNLYDICNKYNNY